jgi:hypothetical protein
MGKRKHTSRNIYISEKMKTHRNNIKAMRLAYEEAKQSNAGKGKIRQLRKSLLSEKAKLKNVRTLRNNLTNTFKRGTALPFSPFGTPSHYKTRRALRARVRRGFRGKEHEHNNAFDALNELSLVRPLTKYEHRKLRTRTKHNRKSNKAIFKQAFQQWDSRRIPLWKTRIVRAS